MPDVYRYTLDRLSSVIDKAINKGLPMIALFPYTEKKKKNSLGTEALNEDNLVCKAIQLVKKKYKSEIGIMCDVALDPYTSHGHDGLLKSGYVLNDETNKILINQSLLQAQMGCDVLAPSDMMDGRIGEIRKSLDKNGFKMTQILSYAVKYASNFYGPFRDAVDSTFKGTRESYQLDCGNRREAIAESLRDEEEGADILMVKPGMPYLDILREIRDESELPLAVYQVSGEYAMIKHAAAANAIDEKAMVLEGLTAFKRAGADLILTYFARQAAAWLD